MLFTFCGKYLLHVYTLCITSQTKFIINECEEVNDCDINSDCIYLNTDGSPVIQDIVAMEKNCCEYTLNIVLLENL